MSIAVGAALAAILLLALFDLWVGVANDAVNFLNSAIGSRVAARRTILVIAGIGILFGALSSSGLMEVARKGVFDPNRFTDPATGLLMIEAIIAVYLGVMAADVLLLDLFNTFGLPTSTTVSIISELVGASVAVTLWAMPGGVRNALTVINAGTVLGIYTAIFASVVIAFSVSAAVMLAARTLLGRDLTYSFPRWGWIWTGLSFASLVYFVIYKGIAKAAILAPETTQALHDRIWLILGTVFIMSAIGGAAMGRNHRAVLGAIVLAGTGALAMAFAGNDLVNFIGPAVAAAQAVFIQGVDLGGALPTPRGALLLAGVVMVLSLVSSRKAQRVTDTEVRLAAHGATAQRFKKTALATSLVAMFVLLGQIFLVFVPRFIKDPIARRTAPVPPKADDPPYDLLRATVNLTVAGFLISLGTANKLPLSTTYITFTAAMGAALGDRIWTRSDAEQRVTGILMVLGGWIVTGFLAAGGAFVMASIIVLGGVMGVPICFVLVILGNRILAAVKEPMAIQHG